jgi:hypothetical protein
MLLDSNKSLSQKVRKGLIVLAVILLLFNLWLIDYGNLFSRENLGAALGGLSNIFIIAAMLVSLRHTEKEKK